MDVVTRLLVRLAYLALVCLGAIGVGAMALVGVRLPDEDPWL